MINRALLVVLLSVGLLSCAEKQRAQLLSKPPLPKTEADCISRSGEWIFAGPQNVTKYCLLKATDGGNSCSTSSQCQSECVEHKTGNTCAEYLSGCFSPTGHGTVTQCVN